MAWEIGNLVTLKDEEEYDRKTVISTEDIGEITDIVDDEIGRHYVVAFQDMLDEEGVTPVCWRYGFEIDLHQI